MIKVLTIFTCFNRKNKTQQCIETLDAGNPECEFTFIAADDGSTDGTAGLLQDMKKKYDLHILQGTGDWFYSGGMHAGMEYALAKLRCGYEYMLMVNDDVEFRQFSIQKLIAQSREQSDAVIAGAMCDDRGSMSYGAVKYLFGYKYRKMDISEWQKPADTFNANCVLIPFEAFEKAGAMDSFYRHSLGDFDYGLSLKKAGYHIYTSREYAGRCNNNPDRNTWTDVNLSRMERLRKKESVKGAPLKQWFYFLKKNFGLIYAVYGAVTPYIRIFMGR